MSTTTDHLRHFTSEQVAAFHRDGFLVVPDLVDAAACDELLAAGERLVDGFDTPAERSVFTTNEQERTSDEYFLASGDRISFFFEEGATDPRTGLNKVGHALHDLDPTFAAFSRAEPLADIVADLGMTDPLLLQSMLIFKHPHIGGEVTSHQDATFLATDPITVMGLWFALADATIENGCLWAEPGGHLGPLRRRFRRAGVGDADGTVFDDLDDTPLPQLDDPAMVPLEVTKGSLVVLHGLLPHGSQPNRSVVPRPAYSVHLIDGAADYPADNWLQRRDLPLRGF